MNASLETMLSFRNSSNEILEEDNSGRHRIINTADIDTLLKTLSTGIEDGDFVSHFLISYRYFITPTLLLKRIVLKLVSSSQLPEQEREIVRKRIMKVLRKWLKEHFYDFDNDPALLKTFQNVLENTIQPISENMASHLNNILIKQLSAREGEEKTIQKIHPTLKIEISSVDPVKLANQLTITTFERFKMIKPTELYFQSWAKENRRISSPNVIEMIDLFNKLSMWVGSEIVSVSSLKKRINVLKQFISVGWAAYGYRDYETTFMISQSLCQYSVERLHQTWNGLDSVTRQQWEILEQFTSVYSNYKNYRKHIKKLFKTSTIHNNVMPYFGLYLKDLTAIEETASNYTRGAINFHKMRLFASIIENILQAQKSIFNFEKDLNTLAVLGYGIRVFDEETIIRLSKKRETHSDKSSKLIGRTLSNVSISVTSQNPIFGVEMKK